MGYGAEQIKALARTVKGLDEVKVQRCANVVELPEVAPRRLASVLDDIAEGGS